MFVTFLETSWVTFKKRTKVKCPFFNFKMKNFCKKAGFISLKHYRVILPTLFYF